MAEADTSANLSAPIAESEARLEFALAAGRLGYWELDPVTRRLFGSAIYKANWGRPAGEPFTYDMVRASLHPDDLAVHEAAVDEAIAKRGNLDVEYRNIWPDGSVHWLRVRGHALYDDAGHADAHGRHFARHHGPASASRRRCARKRARSRSCTRSAPRSAGNLDQERIVQTRHRRRDAVVRRAVRRVLPQRHQRKGRILHALYAVGRPARSVLEISDAAQHRAYSIRHSRATASSAPTTSRQDPRYGKNAPHFGMPKGHLPVVSYLAVPVISRSGEVLGGLFFGHERAGVFTERAERIVAGIAAQAAIAIDNARLYQRRAKRTGAAPPHRTPSGTAAGRTQSSRQEHAGDRAVDRDTDAAPFRPPQRHFGRGFETRIMALAEAHNLLTDSNWEGASLRAMVERVLGPYHGRGRRPLHLQRRRYSRRAEDRGRAGHGAQRTCDQCREIRRAIARGRPRRYWLDDARKATRNRLELSWRETGGPPVKPPSRKGFRHAADPRAI